MEKATSPSTWDEWKKPPSIKVLEALGCIADGRIDIENGGAVVTSSDGSRTYKVLYKDGKVCSTDNGTLYRGYIGYPIIAYLMKKGLLPFDEDLARKLRGIPWKELNERFKKYWLVERYIFHQRGIDEKKVKTFIKRVMEALGKLGLRRLEDEVCSP